MELTRRDFVRAAGGAGLVLGLPAPASAQPTRFIPADKGIAPAALAALRERGERRVYRGPQRHAIGMPIGGICAGQLYILGDGTLGGWRVDGRLNATGYGSANYRAKPPARDLAQGFVIRVGEESRPLESFGSVEFIGEYPIAEVRYRPAARADDRSPIDELEIDLRAYSPFCPLNAKESAIPGTVMRLTLRNTSDRPIAGTLSGHLENGVERADAGDAPVTRRNRVVAEPGLTAVVMDAVAAPTRPDPRPERVLDDFEGDTYAGWTAQGEAFGTGPARGTEPDQNPVTGFDGQGLVNSFRGGKGTPEGDRVTGTLIREPFTIDRDFLTFLIGGGGHSGKTCINLLVDDTVVRTAAGPNNEKLSPRAWDVREFAGRQARLHIVDAASGPWGHVNVDRIALTDVLPPDLQRPRPDSHGNGSMVLAFLGAAGASPGEASAPGPTGSIGAPFDLAPGASTELVFVIAWHFPNLHTGQGQMYTNWFEDALSAARFVRDNDRRLLDRTELFRRTYYDDTTLPWWLALRLMMPTSYLATGTAQWWKNGRFWGWEGVGCCHGTCTHVWNYSHAEARLFPELARSARVMQDFGTGFEAATGRVAFRGEVSGGFEYAADGQCGTVLKSYREHLCSVDDGFLRANWTRIKAALEFLIAKDAELSPAGQPDGVIEGVQHNTYDINFVGANTFVGALYLAALLAGARMARHMGDAESAARYEALCASGRAWTEQNLFNGRYFIQRVPKGQSLQFQYENGCLADHLFGQNWARLLDLGTVYDEGKVRAALASIYRFAWAPPGGSLAQYNGRFPPERVFAEGREGGLFICTWPDEDRPGEPVRYRDEVWTGTEYQAAGGMIWEGLVDEALAIVKAIDDRYDGTLHNPWNEVECGDHYSRAMAAWGVYQAVCGFIYDGPAGRIGMAPRLNAENFAAFFAGAEGWGRLTQSRGHSVQSNRVEVRWGSLRLREFIAELPDIDPKQLTATVARAGEQVPSTMRATPTRVAISLDRPLELAPGDTLEIVFRW